jgi:uncharacterized protein DUF1501
VREELTGIPKLARREFFRVGATSFLGYRLLPMLQPLQARAEEKVTPRGSAEFCIFLFLAGGPPQLDTFDLKEGKWTPPDFDIRTITPEIKMPYALFPKLSQRMNHLALARSVEAWESVHERGQYYVQVGHAFSGARAKEMPSIGSVVAYEYLSRRKDNDFLPPFVAMNFSPGGAGLIGPGMLPATCAPLPFTVEKDADNAFVVPENERARFQNRWDFLRRLDETMRTGKTPMGRPVTDYNNYYLGAYEMMKRPEVGKILQFSEEEHKRYGASGVGDACVLARNLVAADAGTHFIAVAHQGWDLHAKIYDKTQKVNHYTLCRELDDCYSALLDDLSTTKDKQGRTLLDKTMIVCMGEFGRTPGDINANKGRDHYRFASTTVFSGGGVKGGRVIGATDDKGAKVIKTGWHRPRSIYTEDVVASIYSALGIDWTKRITNTPSGRVFDYIEFTSATDVINPDEVKELFV